VPVWPADGQQTWTALAVQLVHMAEIMTQGGVSRDRSGVIAAEHRQIAHDLSNVLRGLDGPVSRGHTSTQRRGSWRTGCIRGAAGPISQSPIPCERQ
jgi:hypothetical protein